MEAHRYSWEVEKDDKARWRENKLHNERLENFITVMKRVNNKLKRKSTTNLDTIYRYLKESDKGGISDIDPTDEEECLPAKRVKMETSTPLTHRSVPQLDLSNSPVGDLGLVLEVYY